MKTAVKWLEEQLNDRGVIDLLTFNKLIQQAKEMEKQQIVDAFNKGFITDQWDKSKENKTEIYYNETFKSE